MLFQKVNIKKLIKHKINTNKPKNILPYYNINQKFKTVLIWSKI